MEIDGMMVGTSTQRLADICQQDDAYVSHWAFLPEGCAARSASWLIAFGGGERA